MLIDRKTSNFLSRRLPWIAVVVVNWVILLGMILKVDPSIVKDVGWPDSYSPFFVMLFVSVGSTVWLVGSSLVRGLVWAVLLTGIFVFRLIGLGHVVNIALLLILLGIYEHAFFWSRG